MVVMDTEVVDTKIFMEVVDMKVDTEMEVMVVMDTEVMDTEVVMEVVNMEVYTEIEVMVIMDTVVDTVVDTSGGGDDYLRRGRDGGYRGNGNGGYEVKVMVK